MTPVWVDRQGAKIFFAIGKEKLQEWEINRWVKVQRNKTKGKKRYCVADLNSIMTALALGKKPKCVIRGKKNV
ncbi:hypothetical protein AAEX28_13380 [Lentisphaerota bacterium WC36G]|nr:hypothetical protein LJT99_00135 [Lentisphaerae bacterium WC36]